MNIKLKFKNEWLEEYKNKQGLAPAWIYLECNNEHYPDDEWIDNPATVLGWWLYSIKELLNGNEGQGLSFMEGPFFINAKLDGDNLILDSEDGKVSWKVNAHDFANTLIKSANETARTFYNAGLKEASENLNQGAKDLRAVLK
ncbi:hypothetical protein ISG33_11055 [Glaciecola sp. MH2013]|uniref:hypothetical protein n=1 Tax=Glaciecola sp. MH2013 TaxID=2785524 RepID=UPI00189F555C|nr:hypothetical protein [Glaciecola sp. MH2013]MBF7073938.1 hypothetical protein [Glaciecola sp. MH2013]